MPTLSAASPHLSSPRLPRLTRLALLRFASPGFALLRFTWLRLASLRLTCLCALACAHSYELGPGKVLSGIMKRVDKKAPPITNVEV